MSSSVTEMAEKRYLKNGGNLPDMECLLESLRTSGLGAVKKVSRRTNRSTSSVYAILEGDQRSWLEEAVQWLDGALEVHGRETALAPLRYLIARYLPDPIGERIELCRGSADALANVAEAVQVALDSVRDDSDGGEAITKEELRTWRRRWQIASTAMTILDREMQMLAERGEMERFREAR